MNYFNSIFMTAVLAAAAFVFLPAPAEAQQFTGYAYQQILGLGTTTNNVAATATNTYQANSGVIVATRQEYLPVAVKYSYHAAPVGGTPSVVLRLERSVDNSNWETTPFHVLTASGATNTCTWMTNLTVGGMPYFRISTIENTNSAVITNLQFYYGLKR
jgi:hypothetical protein